MAAGQFICILVRSAGGTNLVLFIWFGKLGAVMSAGSVPTRQCLLCSSLQVVHCHALHHEDEGAVSSYMALATCLPTCGQRLACCPASKGEGGWWSRIHSSCAFDPSLLLAPLPLCRTAHGRLHEGEHVAGGTATSVWLLCQSWLHRQPCLDLHARALSTPAASACHMPAHPLAAPPLSLLLAAGALHMPRARGPSTSGLPWFCLPGA